MRELILHPEVDPEIDDAFGHYLAISPRLAKRFRDEIDTIFREIVETPYSWGFYEPLASHRRWRRRVAVSFPYVVIYEEVPKGIRVVAVAHTSRRPGYWIDR